MFSRLSNKKCALKKVYAVKIELINKFYVERYACSNFETIMLSFL